MANPNAVRRPPRVSQVHIDETRARIKAHMIITKLQTFALGTPVEEVTIVNGNAVYKTMIEDENGERRPAMTPDQVRAACKLLDYVLPTLKAVEVNVTEAKTYVLRAPLPAKDADEWLAQYGPRTIEGTKQ
jgi:hypothetical protein